VNNAESDQSPPRLPPLSERQRRLGHEVRSTAQGLLGYINILSDEMHPQMTPEQAMVMERIWHYGKRLSELSMELLNEIQDLAQQIPPRQPE